MTYRHWATCFIYVIIGSVLGGVAGSLVMAAVARSRLEGPGLVVLGLLILCGAWRGLTVRVVEHPDGLVVRNMFRTYVIHWDEIVCWVECQPADLKGVPCPGVRTSLRRKPIPLLGMAYWESPISGEPTRKAEMFAETVERWGRSRRRD